MRARYDYNQNWKVCHEYSLLTLIDSPTVPSSSNASTGNRQRGEQEGNALTQRLPSEQDRKAILGCIAAVLNMMFAARKRVDKGAPVVVDGNKDGELSDGAPAANFSICDDEDTDTESRNAPAAAAASSASLSSLAASVSSSMGRTTSTALEQQQKRRRRRTKAFQRELLIISAELLFLTPDHAQVFLPNLDIQCTDDEKERELLLQPFLESLSSREESFRCIALLMLRFLLLSGEEKPAQSSAPALGGMSIVGYDARVRYAFKSLAVAILSYWETKEHDFMTPENAAAFATRKFEALEDGIALRMSLLSQIMTQEKASGRLSGQRKQSSLGASAIRGLKIGAAGVAAGTVFAITGGLAAPAIVGGIAALTGVGSAATFVATVLLLPAATTIFGVGGGTLVASKMSKRTAGLSEFDIIKVTGDSGADGKRKKSPDNPELSRTVCISGWLKDEHDFERPFGVTPHALTDPHEIFCRYCSVYAPHIIPRCKGILEGWKGKEDELFDMCTATYGKDPRSLLPFETGSRFDALLTENENEAVDDTVRSIGLPFPKKDTEQSTIAKSQEPAVLLPPVNLFSEVLVSNNDDEPKKELSDAMRRLYRAWDFHACFGSELYITRWETELLRDLYGSAKEFQSDLAKKAAGEALKKTAMASLMAAVALPAALVSLSNMIDEKWTLAKERSDEAGILLAQSLLNSNAGHRPVSLIGFSFGARMIIACLTELARHQATWERQQQETSEQPGTDETKSSFRRSLNSMSKSKDDGSGVVRTVSREPASIIEDVILMGTPASVNKSTWLSCREVVAGRLVNCYSRNDMILALMYRAKNMSSSFLNPPAGVQAAEAQGVENFDVSMVISSHSDYCVAVKDVLAMVGYNQPRS